MGKTSPKIVLLERRQRRGRKNLSGTVERPRLRVTRTLKHITAQLIDDTSGKTLASASSLSLKIPGGNVNAAKEVGKALAEAAKAKSITAAAFDRGGRLYHGRIKALAEAAREGGLQF